MYQVIIVIHVLLGLGVIGLVLMQQGKGADAGAAFGTGSSGSVFGAQGAASFLSRTTAIFAALFFTTSLGLAVLNSHKGAVYDLMNSPSGEQDTLSSPKGADTNADTVPVVPSSSIPAASLSTEQKTVEVQSPVSSAEIKDTVVPKVEDIKAVEDNTAAADKSKNTPKGK